MPELDDRAAEIAEYLGVDYHEARGRLSGGFHHNHALVAADFNEAGTNVDDPDSLLNWYRNTTAYIYELSAYHLDEGFNYKGMCAGVVEYTKAHNKPKVLCLGDGIGDLSLDLAKAGLKPTYHDLKDSKTAGYAQFRFERAGYDVATRFTDSFDPTLGSRLFDGVVALDFLEHVVNVPEWVGHIHKALKKGGVFMAQNAFAIGSGPDGSIPMHLEINDRFERDWIPLMEDIGFVNETGGDWWTKP